MKGDARALTQLAPGIRLVLLYGPDTSASADHARSVARRFPDADGELVIAAASLTGDPAALVAAASEIPMFGGTRVIRVDDAGEDVLGAVSQLLDAAVTSPVVIVAGVLKKGSKLVARVEAAADAIAVVSYAPDAAATASAIVDIASGYGLRLARDAIAAIAQATAGDRGVARQEIAKLALYVDARPDAPASVALADVAAIGADLADADLGALVDGVVGGNPAEVSRQLVDFAATVPGIVMVRAVARRLWLLLDLRAAVDGGASASRAVDAARPPIFWKDRPLVVMQVAKWRTGAIRTALTRILDAERAVKRSGSAGDVAVNQLLLSLSVQAARG